MTPKQAKIGTRVRSLVDFCAVPKGTEGVIDEDYGTGVMVAWDLPDQPLPPGYRQHDGRPAIATRILRDGFDKERELCYLEPACTHEHAILAAPYDTCEDCGAVREHAQGSAPPDRWHSCAACRLS